MRRQLSTLARTVTAAVERMRPRALILAYHRVAEIESDPQLLGVTPERFAQHLAHLRARYHPMSLLDLAGGRAPRRGVVVTFDDGYADNLHHARPLLERYEAPATVFVVAGQIGQAREFWWDELERLLLQPGALPETLALTVNGQAYQWALGDAADYSPSDHQRHRGWNVLSATDPTPRHSVYRALHPLLRPLAPEEREHLLEALRAWAGAEPAGRPTHRALSPGEVRALAAGGLVDVGAHSVRHPVLSMLPLEAQRAEIAQSQARLAELLGRPARSFSYPYGAPGDYTAETVALVREAGFACACANHTGVVGADTDRFALPRFLVRNWDLDTFARQVEAWFGG